jgi:hypothetical protein
MAADELSDVQGKLTALAKANIPEDDPLAKWSMVFQLSGKQVASANWFEV